MLKNEILRDEKAFAEPETKKANEFLNQRIKNDNRNKAHYGKS